ncbi:unnamed protein product [Cuscuta campestris]|uniref:Uncharacterized protein n=1 Tax=Cuscuta campestris TaxID=132261 RepID=A0A484MGL4_9ASTE|nr:unnamed protein product [Cuscuta campestris]
MLPHPALVAEFRSSRSTTDMSGDVQRRVMEITRHQMVVGDENHKLRRFSSSMSGDLAVYERLLCGRHMLSV